MTAYNGPALSKDANCPTCGSDGMSHGTIFISDSSGGGLGRECYNCGTTWPIVPNAEVAQGGNTEHIVLSQIPITEVAQNLMVCPVCGWEAQDGGMYIAGIKVALPTRPDLNGNYCMACWAEQIKSTTPKMVRK